MVKKNKSSSSNQIKNWCLKRLQRQIWTNQANDSYLIEENSSKFSKDQKRNDDLQNKIVEEKDFKDNNQNQQLDINNDIIIQQQQKYRYFQLNCNKKIYTYFSKCSQFVNNHIFNLKEMCLSFYYSFTNQRVLIQKKNLQKQNQLLLEEQKGEQEKIEQEEKEDKQEQKEVNTDKHDDDRIVEEQQLDKCQEYRILNSKEIRLFKILSEEGFSNFEMLNDNLEVSLLRAYQNSLNCNVIIQAYHSNFGNENLLKYREDQRAILKILKVIQNNDETINYIVFQNYKQTLAEQIDIYCKANKQFNNQEIQKIILSIFQYFKSSLDKLKFEIENVVQLENGNYVIFDLRLYTENRFQLWKQFDDEQNYISQIGILLSILYGYPINELIEQQKYKNYIKLEYSTIKNQKYRNLFAFLKEYVFEGEQQFQKVTHFIIKLSQLFSFNISQAEFQYITYYYDVYYQFGIINSESKINDGYKKIASQFYDYYSREQNKEIIILYAKTLQQWKNRDIFKQSGIIQYCLDQKQYNECLKLQLIDLNTSYNKAKQLCVIVYCYLKLNDIEKAKQYIFLLTNKSEEKYAQIIDLFNKSKLNKRLRFIQFQYTVFDLLNS